MCLRKIAACSRELLSDRSLTRKNRQGRQGPYCRCEGGRGRVERGRRRTDSVRYGREIGGDGIRADIR